MWLPLQMMFESVVKLEDSESAVGSEASDGMFESVVKLEDSESHVDLDLLG